MENKKEPIIKELEREAKGIVSINFDEKPKKKAIQNIRTIKKPFLKPQEIEIQQEEAVKKPEIEDLQQEIDNQKELLELRIKQIQEEKIKLLKEEKIRKKAEKRERIMKHWYLRILHPFMRKAKPKQIQEVIYQNPNEIKLIELDYTNLKRCPICNKKLKKTKVEYDFNILRQVLKCKKCDFKKEIAIKL